LCGSPLKVPRHSRLTSARKPRTNQPFGQSDGKHWLRIPSPGRWERARHLKMPFLFLQCRARARVLDPRTWQRRHHPVTPPWWGGGVDSLVIWNKMKRGLARQSEMLDESNFSGKDFLRLSHVVLDARRLESTSLAHATKMLCLFGWASRFHARI
jgi:hypothetical protein